MSLNTKKIADLHTKAQAGTTVTEADIHAAGVSPADLTSAQSTGLTIPQILALIAQYGQQFITLLPMLLQILSMLGGLVPPAAKTKP